MRQTKPAPTGYWVCTRCNCRVPRGSKCGRCGKREKEQI